MLALWGLTACASGPSGTGYPQAGAAPISRGPVDLVYYEYNGQYLASNSGYCEVGNHEVDEYRGRVSVWIAGPNGVPGQYHYMIRVRSDGSRVAQVVFPRICHDHDWAYDRYYRRQARIDGLNHRIILRWTRTYRPFE